MRYEYQKKKKKHEFWLSLCTTNYLRHEGDNDDDYMILTSSSSLSRLREKFSGGAAPFLTRKSSLHEKSIFSQYF